MNHHYFNFTKCRTLYLLYVFALIYRSIYIRLQDVCEGHPQDVSLECHQDIGSRHPQDVSRRRDLVFHTETYGDVIRTLYWDLLSTSCLEVLRTLIRDVTRTLVWSVPWRYILGNMGTFMGLLLGTSSGHPRDVSVLIQNPSLEIPKTFHQHGIDEKAKMALVLMF